MPYIEVKLNNVVIACAGAEDIGVLTASVIAGSTGGVSVGVHGMRVADPKSNEHLDWVSKFLNPGDRLEFNLLSNAKPTPPTSRTSHSSDQKQILAELEKMREHFRERYPEGVPSLPRVPGPVVLCVATSSQSRINASLGDEEQLQAVLNWTQQSCTPEVDSLTVLESGYTKGQRWLGEELSPGQKVEVTYAT